MKKDIQDYYKTIGVRFVFLNKKENESFAEIINNILRLVNAKKQQEEESVQSAVDQMLKKCFDSFYRQLARSWHPDLERDYKQRALKEELIKKLTLAYKNNDLIELLILEIESKNSNKNFRASADILLLHECVEIAQAYGHGLDVISKVKIKFMPLKKRVRSYKPLVKAIQNSK